MASRCKNQNMTQGELEELVAVSRIVGINPAYVLWGGGNSSIKVNERDFSGAEIPVLRIKGTGVDMKTVTVQDFAGVRLNDVEPLRGRDAMDDEEMVAYLAHCLTDPDKPRPSIETLLHAFLPFPVVIHSHADVILALADTATTSDAVRAALGDRVVLLPYLRPGFAMAKTAAEAVEAVPGAEGMVLAHHGLVTWGNSPQEAYEAHAALIERMERFLAGRPPCHVSRRERWSRESREQLGQRMAPLVRRALGGTEAVVLDFADNEQLLAFVERQDVETITQIGATTPDHLLHTKNVPVVIPARPDMTDQELSTLVEQRVKQFQICYREYFERYNGSRFTMRSPSPTVVVVPGLGIWAAGSSAHYARMVLEIYQHTVSVIEMAEQMGGYRSLPEPKVFEAEYWPLELYKLTLRPDRPELGGRIALVTGAAAGIGAAVAGRLAQAGAVVVLADRDSVRLQKTKTDLETKVGSGQVFAVEMDVADENQVGQVFATIIRTYGGLDILVSNAGTAVTGNLTDLSLAEWERSLRVNVTGHFMVTRQALRLMSRQGLGGNIVFIVSKNAFVPGRGFGAYSVAKAAELQLGRIAAIEHGADGIRVNMINPDAIWTDLWSPALRAERAKAYHIDENELEDYYRRRSLLQRVVTANDVAEAVLFFVSERAGKTTGAVLPVDAGIREGFPR